MLEKTTSVTALYRKTLMMLLFFRMAKTGQDPAGENVTEGKSSARIEKSFQCAHLQ
jgi:hypothetical protein